MLETLDYTIRIGSTPTFLYFDLYLYSAYAAHYVYYFYEGTAGLVIKYRGWGGGVGGGVPVEKRGVGHHFMLEKRGGPEKNCALH